MNMKIININVSVVVTKLITALNAQVEMEILHA